jgi:hypothetical protein
VPLTPRYQQRFRAPAPNRRGRPLACLSAYPVWSPLRLRSVRRECAPLWLRVLLLPARVAILLRAQQGGAWCGPPLVDYRTFRHVGQELQRERSRRVGGGHLVPVRMGISIKRAGVPKKGGCTTLTLVATFSAAFPDHTSYCPLFFTASETSSRALPAPGCEGSTMLFSGPLRSFRAILSNRSLSRALTRDFRGLAWTAGTAERWVII